MRGWNVLTVFYSTQTGTLGPNSLTWGGGGGGGKTLEKLFTRLLYFWVLTERGTPLDTFWIMTSPSLISLQLQMRKKIKKQTNIRKAYVVKYTSQTAFISGNLIN